MIIEGQYNRFLIRWIFISSVLLGCVVPSFAVPATVDRIVDLYGQLRVEGNKIVDQNGNPIALRGMSLFWGRFRRDHIGWNGTHRNIPAVCIFIGYVWEISRRRGKCCW